MRDNDYLLQQMGIEQWTERLAKPAAPAENAIAEPQAQAMQTLDWQALRERVLSCQACPLHATRTNGVFGVGNQQADLLVVGEAPGYYEDQQGEPFVGRAGQLLTAMLKAIGLQREEVYIANVLKCRPPQNRDPKAQEVALCSSFLDRQIALLQPKVMLAVGRIAAHYLLNSQLSMAKLRGQTYHYGESDTPLLVTYHPAYLLRSPKDKLKAWYDLQRVKQILI